MEHYLRVVESQQDAWMASCTSPCRRSLSLGRDVDFVCFFAFIHFFLDDLTYSVCIERDYTGWISSRSRYPKESIDERCVVFFLDVFGLTCSVCI